MNRVVCTAALVVEILTILFTGLVSCSKKSTEPEPEPKTDYQAPLASTAPVIDGKDNDACWNKAAWAGIDYLWLGTAASSGDFSGRYKIVWTSEKLYLLIEITDDVLSDVYSNPLDRYWEDDCLEFFIDEDHSGGIHQYSHNAFAYHIALDYRAVDIGPDNSPHEYTHHVTALRISNGNTHTWEIALDVYTDAYVDQAETNPKAELKAGKLMGYAVAYCDSDDGGYRENFYGSMNIPGTDKNRAWIDASILGTLMLVD
jgi:hypothetical protein